MAKLRAFPALEEVEVISDWASTRPDAQIPSFVDDGLPDFRRHFDHGTAEVLGLVREQDVEVVHGMVIEPRVVIQDVLV